ncbi:MAG: response regulator transcription factor [Verrucomicrobiota bacterium]|jgi:DNA-binding NarL/FixJ family response regulator
MMAHSANNKRVRVLLVDDHPLVRQGLRHTIAGERDLVVCGEAEDRAGALAAIAATQPNLVIVDLSLKNSSGLELIKDIHKRHPRTFVLVLSMHDESLYAERAIQAGASGYISKQEAATKVLDAVRRILGGEIYWSERAAAQIASRVARPGRAGRGGPLNRLSDRELEIFELIGSGWSTARIAGQLHIDVSTVETYRARIKEKMGLNGTGELLQAAIRWHVSKAAGQQVWLERSN